MVIAPNTILAPGSSTQLIEALHRVLVVDTEKDTAWIISLRRQTKSGANKPYMTRPIALTLSTIKSELTAGSLKVGTFDPPSHWGLSDEDYLSSAPNEKERAQRESRQKRRDATWQSIAPLVKNLTTAELVKRLPRASAMIIKRARECGVNPSTLYSRIHLYLAHGSTLNGLLPGTDRCGGPGQEREQSQHIGPQSKAFKSGCVDSPGYVLSEKDKERLGRGFALIGPTRSKMDAFLLVSAAFWSTVVAGIAGAATPQLWEPHLRPSFAQFEEWGSRRSGALDRRRWFGFSASEESPTHHGGSSQDLVCAVGQYSMIDATSTDVCLTSMFSRLRKLPPQSRTLVKEVRSTAYLGLYTGWEKPSPRTSLLAILNGAQDKSKFCAKYGIKIAEGDWPGMLCRTNLVDNGELRAEEATEAERQIGFSIEFAKTYHGASKGDVEAQHNTDHKMVDHKVPGSNRGKRHERGMPNALDDALWNHYEYMHELLLHIIAYNNTEVPHLAPTAMKIAGIRPTRINIFKWLRDHDQAADVSCDLEHLRALTLPSWPAVMQHNGIILKSPDGKRNLPDIRFHCDELESDHRYTEARRKRVCVPIDVRCNGNDLEAVWFASGGRLRRVPNVISDNKLLREGTVSDLLDYMESEDEHRRNAEANEQQAKLDRLIQREVKTDTARAQAREEAASSGKPSKKKQRENLRANATAELEALQPPLDPAFASGSQPVRAEPAGAPIPNAAQSAVADFLASISKQAGSP
jgi:hypothetical protein